MINIIKKSKCCGCFGCENICPKNCITMKSDDEGFLYPEINMKECINCNLCSKVCPEINNIDTLSIKKSNAYACKNKSTKDRMKSSSGGVFFLLCEYVIQRNGLVFGAKFNENFKVVHSLATTIDDCKEFRGSKYVQSEIGSTYNEAKKYLDEGKLVLFTGTQCQIKGLNLFLKKQYENLITIDIICHGVPSPLVFKQYINNLRKVYKSNIKYIGFREKDKGWKNFSLKLEFGNGEEYSKIFKEDIFMRGFLSNLYLRPSCYSCEAKSNKSGSDISLADYWGVDNKHREFDDDKGVSLILVNSDKGQSLIKDIESNLEIIETELDYAINNNPCILKASNYNENREKFFRELEIQGENNLESIILKYIKPKLIIRVKSKVKKVIYKIINNIR